MYVLLESLFTKADVDISPNESNFPVYLINRYISFYHPNLCIFIDDAMNKLQKLDLLSDSLLAYKTYKAIIPKLPYHKIEYVKKPVSNTASKYQFNDTELSTLANLLEISKREVLEDLRLMDKIG